jgi:hypothetical protein
LASKTKAPAKKKTWSLLTKASKRRFARLTSGWNLGCAVHCWQPACEAMRPQAVCFDVVCSRQDPRKLLAPELTSDVCYSIVPGRSQPI